MAIEDYDSREAQIANRLGLEDSLAGRPEHEVDDMVVFSPESEVVSTSLGATADIGGDVIAHLQQPSVGGYDMRLDTDAENAISARMERRPDDERFTVQTYEPENVEVFDPDEEEVVEVEAEPEIETGDRPGVRHRLVNDEGVEVGSHWSLEQIERVVGMAEEREEATKKAIRVQEVDETLETEREERCRRAVVEMDRYYRAQVEEVDGQMKFVGAVPSSKAFVDERFVSRKAPVGRFDVEVEPPVENPWEELTREQLAGVNKGAQQLADHFGDEAPFGRGAISKLLARRVLDGMDITDAVFDLRDAIYRLPKVVQPIPNIDPFDQYETTVEVTVDVLWTPKDTSQYQVGLVSDEANEQVKFTVWQRAGKKPMLREGDKIRVTGAKVNAYKRNGEYETTLAVAADTDIHHIERGSGDATRMAFASDEPSVAPWSADSKQHAWINGVDREEAFLATVDFANPIQAKLEGVRPLQIHVSDRDEDLIGFRPRI